MQYVTHVVVKTVNFVRKQSLNHRQFQQLLLEMDAEYGDLSYYCEVRWVSRVALLQRVYGLNEIAAFLAQKGVRCAKPIHVVHWLNPTCTLLPTQFATSSYVGSIWLQMSQKSLF